jgi:hypothetical protein
MDSTGKEGPVTRADKPLLDKLGVKPGHRVSLLGLDEDWFVADLRGRGADVSFRRRQGSDLIFLGCGSPRDLTAIGGLERYLVRNGAVWVLTPKGVKEINQNDAMRAGLAVGLVDNKIAAFSDRWSAIRFVIPLARR